VSLKELFVLRKEITLYRWTNIISPNDRFSKDGDGVFRAILSCKNPALGHDGCLTHVSDSEEAFLIKKYIHASEKSKTN